MLFPHKLFCSSIYFKTIIAVDISSTPSFSDPTASFSCEYRPNGRYPREHWCTPTPLPSAPGAIVDDAPVIQAAIDAAGVYYSYVLLPAGSIFTIRSPIHITNTVLSGFVISGALKVAGTEKEWGGIGAVIKLTNNNVFHLDGDRKKPLSDIDATDVHFAAENTLEPPPLIKVIAGHSLYPSSLNLINAPGSFWQIEGKAMIARNISMTTQAGYGAEGKYAIEIGKNSSAIGFESSTWKNEGKGQKTCAIFNGVELEDCNVPLGPERP